MEHALGDLLRRGHRPTCGGRRRRWCGTKTSPTRSCSRCSKGARGAFNLPPMRRDSRASWRAPAAFALMRVPRRSCAASPRLLAAGCERLGLRPRPIRRGSTSATATMVMSSDKARRELGWKPRARRRSTWCSATSRCAAQARSAHRALVLPLLQLAAARAPRSPEEARRLDLQRAPARSPAPPAATSAHFDHGRMRIGAACRARRRR